MTVRNRRILSADFMPDLQGGFLNPVLAVTQADPTLSINIRRDCINIYYRGGSLMRLARQAKGSYACRFDSNYCSATTALGTLPVVDCAVLPTRMAPGDSQAVATWVTSISLLKSAMDLHLGRNPKDEREFQQLIERTNNRNYATNYYVCDIEYCTPALQSSVSTW